MKHELFVDQPVLELKEGIRVTEDTALEYKSDKVEQELKNLLLETLLHDEGTNGVNSYKSTSHLYIRLNPGDILLFDVNRGYYMPPYPVTGIDDAISDVGYLADIPRYKDRE